MAIHSIEEALVARIQELTPEKQQEVLDFAEFLASRRVPGESLKSARGLWKDLGIRISAEEIDEARKEMWSSFPREEVSR